MHDAAGGPVHAHSLPPDLNAAPALAANLAASRLGLPPSRPQGPLASAQTLPATR